MSDNKKKKVFQIHVNESLPTVFVDNLMITTRTDSLYLVRFTTSLPEGLKEQCRMMIPKESMRGMLDVLCKQCDYFPSKPKQNAKTKTKTK